MTAKIVATLDHKVDAINFFLLVYILHHGVYSTKPFYNGMFCFAIAG
jgi:hypothetical protein